jgi:hypothetical protein
VVILGLATTLALAGGLAAGAPFAMEAVIEGAIEWKVIPAESCQGLWIVPFVYDGEPGGTLRLILDTGASTTSLDPDAIRRVFGRKVRAGKKVRIRNVHAGPLKIRSLRVRTHELDHLRRALGSEVDGILGFRVFEELLLALDYPAGEVRVATGSLPAVDGATVFRDVGTVRPYLVLDLGGERLPVLIDSGSAGGLTLRESDSVRWEVDPRPLAASVGYDSIRLQRTGRAAGAYAFGPSVLERPRVDLRKDGARLIGFEILRHSSWTFDTRHHRIRITPASPSPISSVPMRGAGFALRPVAAGFEIIQLFPNTPAAEVGLRAGDVLTAIDGEPIFERGCRSVSESGDGQRLLLTVDREGEQFEVAVEIGVLVP